MNSLHAENSEVRSQPSVENPLKGPNATNAQWNQNAPVPGVLAIIGDVLRVWGWQPLCSVVVLLVILDTLPWFMGKMFNLHQTVPSFLWTAAVPAGIVPSLLMPRLNFSAPHLLSRLQDRAKGVAQFPVRVRLYDCGICFGSDVGVISFVGGQLCFTGTETAFGLSRNRARTSHRSASFMTARFSIKYTDLDGARRTMRIEPFQKHRIVRLPPADLYSAVLEWSRYSPPTYEKHAVLPPNRPKPIAVQAARLVAWLAVALAVIVCSVAACLFFAGQLLLTPIVTIHLVTGTSLMVVTACHKALHLRSMSKDDGVPAG